MSKKSKGYNSGCPSQAYLTSMSYLGRAEKVAVDVPVQSTTALTL